VQEIGSKENFPLIRCQRTTSGRAKGGWHGFLICYRSSQSIDSRGLAHNSHCGVKSAEFNCGRADSRFNTRKTKGATIGAHEGLKLLLNCSFVSPNVTGDFAPTSANLDLLYWEVGQFGFRRYDWDS
jgi:hypothetical protein